MGGGWKFHLETSIGNPAALSEMSRLVCGEKTEFEQVSMGPSKVSKACAVLFEPRGWFPESEIAADDEHMWSPQAIKEYTVMALPSYPLGRYSSAMDLFLGRASQIWHQNLLCSPTCHLGLMHVAEISGMLMMPSAVSGKRLELWIVQLGYDGCGQQR